MSGDGEGTCHILTSDLYRVAAFRRECEPFKLASHTPEIKKYAVEDLANFKLTPLQTEAVMGFYRELYLIHHLSLEEIAQELGLAPSNLRKYKEGGLIKVARGDWANLRQFIIRD